MINVKLLGEFADVFGGYPIKSQDRVAHGDYLLARGRNIIDGSVFNTAKDIYVNNRSDEKFKKCILQEGDLLVNLNFCPAQDRYLQKTLSQGSG